MHIVIGLNGAGRYTFVDPDSTAVQPSPPVAASELAHAVVALERSSSPRWVWADTRRVYPNLLEAGVRVARCVDLRTSGALLDGALGTATTRAAHDSEPAPAWLQAFEMPVVVRERGLTLFDDLGDLAGGANPGDRDAERGIGTDSTEPTTRTGEPLIDEVLREFSRQQRLLDASAQPNALRLLCAAESVGTLIGSELVAAGLPWSRTIHDSVLTEALGPRPVPGRKPELMERRASEVRELLGAPTLNLDSQVALLRALRAAGIRVESTSKWELQESRHPVVAPLLDYKRMARLLSANGWAWIDEWVHDGRFRPEYVPGGTATGRWATSGGGALQLPKAVRRAVSADPGWSLVVADAAQLEPRVLAAMSGDEQMATAARGTDFYRGLVDAGVVTTRDEAKVAILGAMYGSTTGESGRLVPRLARAYPRAMALVDRAAATGERGGQVATRLGRTSPEPPERWHAVQSEASAPGATATDESRARSSAREWGRFTRNFVVQGTAAEWALCWMAELRKRLVLLAPHTATIESVEVAQSDEADATAARASAAGPVFARMPHLVYFLHDEIIVHTPTNLAAAVVTAVRESAISAGQLLFGDFPIDFPLAVATVQNYGDADDD